MTSFISESVKYSGRLTGSTWHRMTVKRVRDDTAKDVEASTRMAEMLLHDPMNKVRVVSHALPRLHRLQQRQGAAPEPRQRPPAP